MDYPKSDAGARLQNGKFTDGDPVNNIPPSKDSAVYQNMVFDELINAITAGGLEPDQTKSNQLTEAIIAKIETSLAGHSEAEDPHTQYVTKEFLDQNLPKMRSIVTYEYSPAKAVFSGSLFSHVTRQSTGVYRAYFATPFADPDDYHVLSAGANSDFILGIRRKAEYVELNSLHSSNNVFYDQNWSLEVISV